MGGICLSLSGGKGTAQASASEPLPPPPYLADLPERAKWTVSMEMTAPSKNGPPDIRPMTSVLTVVNKYPEGRFDAMKFASGAESDQWLIKGYRIRRTPGSSDIDITRLAPKPAADWLQTMDMSELSWVRNAKPISWNSWKGQKALYFEADVPNPVLVEAGMAPNRISTVKMKAWINAATLLPMAFDNGVETFEYTFQTPSGADFSLPPEVEARLVKFAKRMNALY